MPLQSILKAKNKGKSEKKYFFCPYQKKFVKIVPETIEEIIRQLMKLSV
jgi:hypothetical protein